MEMYYELEDKRERFNEDLVYIMYETQEREDRKLELLSALVAQWRGNGTYNPTAGDEAIPVQVVQIIIHFI